MREAVLGDLVRPEHRIAVSWYYRLSGRTLEIRTVPVMSGGYGLLYYKLYWQMRVFPVIR